MSGARRGSFVVQFFYGLPAKQENRAKMHHVLVICYRHEKFVRCYQPHVLRERPVKAEIITLQISLPSWLARGPEMQRNVFVVRPQCSTM
jgi:hypothetical protein